MYLSIFEYSTSDGDNPNRGELVKCSLTWQLSMGYFQDEEGGWFHTRSPRC